MTIKNKLKFVVSVVVMAAIILGTFPSPSFGAQSTDYTDPADTWITAGSRTNELDNNATVTHETLPCSRCETVTNFMLYRVPEYTKSGETALNHDVMYSDGTCVDGRNKGNTDSGTPGENAYYTGYHYSKSVCEKCGTINSNVDKNRYEYNKNVYTLYSCEQGFFLDFDNTTYKEYNSKQHIATHKSGEYCQFCKGTKARANTVRENHNFNYTVDPQIGHNRFFVSEKCTECKYKTNDFVSAKAVVTSYYGNVDGEAHTVSVTDLSDDDVHVAIHYGTSAGDCDMTTAPTFVKEGYYTVYYEIDYQYDGENMTESGVAYVWLLDNSNKVNAGNHTHDYRYLETVKPTCSEFGYERWQCNICGGLIKQNYVPAKGHNYQSTTLKEATCQSTGLNLEICSSCGTFREQITDIGDHKYKTEKVKSTCKSVGYTNHECEVCGDNYITDITSIISHDFNKIIKEPTCTDGGYTTYICSMCNILHTDDYTEPLGHDWNDGNIVTSSTCEADGVMEFECQRCGEKMLKAENATGHTPGPAATCTEPQVCENCNAILAIPTGHHYTANETKATCTDMGYTTYTCEDCGETYNADYTDALEHTPSDWIIDTAATIEHAGEKHIECLTCHNVLTRVDIPQLTETDRSDEDGAVKIGNYSILVTDSKAVPVFNCKMSIDINDNVTIQLPEKRLLNYADQTIITAIYTETKEPKADLKISISDSKRNFATGKTDASGQLKVPNSESNIGNNNGTIGGGDGENKYTYVVTVTDKENNVIPNCKVYIGESNNVVVELPDGRILTQDSPVIVTVTDHNGKAQQNVTVIAIADKDYIEKGITDANGKVTLPPVNSGYTDNNGSVKIGDYTVIVEDTKAKLPNAFVRLEDGKISVNLPDTNILTVDNQITVTVLDKGNKPAKGISVTVTDKKDVSAIKATDANGKITVPSKSSGGGSSSGGNKNNVVAVQPSKTHSSYVVGYTDGSFKPNGNMSRAEAAAIFARLISEQKGEQIKGKSSFTDIQTNNWYSEYVSYLEKYGVIKGYTDNTFKPNIPVTRSEFVAMTVRFHSLFNKVSYPANTTKYNDIQSNYWGLKDISFATAKDWLNGYSDGSFKPDNFISRAEVVTVVNHAVNRNADESYINNNFAKLNKFTDLTNNSHWAFYDIVEAANTHDYTEKSGNETWQ